MIFHRRRRERGETLFVCHENDDDDDERESKVEKLLIARPFAFLRSGPANKTSAASYTAINVHEYLINNAGIMCHVDA